MQTEARGIIRKWPHADLLGSMQGQGPGAGGSSELRRWFSKHKLGNPGGASQGQNSHKDDGIFLLHSSQEDAEELSGVHASMTD